MDYEAELAIVIGRATHTMRVNIATNAQNGGLKPIGGRSKLGDEVTRRIRDTIMSGGYVAGQKLVVDDLAQHLGVSTMPVREALVALAHEGILDVSPRRGFRIAQLAANDIEDIFMVQAFLAGLLAERATPVMNQGHMDQLYRIQAEVEALGEHDSDEVRAKIEDCNYRFHRAINHVVEASRLRWFLRAATQYVPRHIYETIPSWTRLTIVDHPAIIEALARRDAETARRRVEEHVKRCGTQVLENLKARGFWS